MNDSARTLFSVCGRLFGSMLVMLVMLGCQSLSFNPRGRSVPESSWIALPRAGEYSTTWTNDDLTLDYKFVRDIRQLKISGSIQFADRITNSFRIIQYFHLDAIPVDAQGKVLDMIGLCSDADVNTLLDHSLDFSRILTLPANTAAIAFSYRGRAYEGDGGDGGGIMDFWEYPIY
jgi:hypothetical protein